MAHRFLFHTRASTKLISPPVIGNVSTPSNSSSVIGALDHGARTARISRANHRDSPPIGSMNRW